ncbi:T9SS type A sorting domain-containing protein [Winogradskyella sp.]|uniref:T9SS type A sorting domain-containing protein n=1 Tax=Winogradskyella sp. TaxID=1883156 RepID=UPI0025D71EC3|nr:T9SS type A sorting domain-containing protein [Winogradskyella sp.]
MRTISKLPYLLFLLFCINFSQAQSEIQRVRIDFENTDGYTRHLLLGFVPDNSASDGFDYGYDALNNDDLEDDLNWIIDDGRYIIQGVGAFNSNKYYPLGMFLTNTGDISISLTELENFENEIDVYLYDLESNTYALLNETNFDKNLSANTYLNRFYITFSNSAHIEISNNSLLSTNDNESGNLKIWHSNHNDLLHINGKTIFTDTTLSLYNMEGKKLVEEKITNKSYSLDTSTISKGIYIVKINSDTFSHSTKVCITD